MTLSLQEIERMILVELKNIIRSSKITRNKLRFTFADQSFLEIFKSNNIINRWAFHWERKHVDGMIYRHDNVPHKSWKKIESFPWHYHFKFEENVIKSDFSNDIIQNVQKLIIIIKERFEI